MGRACDIAAQEWESCRKSGAGCRSDAIDGLPTLRAIVRAYCERHRPRARAELAFYASLPSLREAVRRASRAERPDGKRHGHQTRIRRPAIREAGRQLLQLNLRTSRDFHELYTRIHEAIA